jgi:hypothetical protein
LPVFTLKFWRGQRNGALAMLVRLKAKLVGTQQVLRMAPRPRQSR